MTNDIQVHYRQTACETVELQETIDSLVRQRDRYIHLYNQQPAGSFTLTREGVVVEANETGAALQGVIPAKLVQGCLLDYLSPGSIDDFLAHLQTVADGPPDKGVFLTFRSSEGRLRHGRLVTRRMPDGNVLATLVQCDQTETPAGETEGRQRRQEALDQFASGLVHEFNHIVTGISGNVYLLLQSLPVGSLMRDGLEEIGGLCRRATELCRHVQCITGRVRPQLQAVNLNTILRDMANLLQINARGLATIDLTLADELPEVDIDPVQFRQVMINLVQNAAEAMERPGVITVATSLLHCDPAALQSAWCSDHAAPETCVCVQVRDFGRGIKQEYLDRVFDPFFSTKSAGRGLGLSFVAGIMRSHRAPFAIASEQNRGTTVSLYFPARP